MLYAILCYNDEAAVGAWSEAEDAAVMADLAAVETKLAEEGRLGPVARLKSTSTAKTLRKDRPASVLDGPFTETKEVLLGFYIVECAGFEDAVATVEALVKANPGKGGYEIRPVAVFHPGVGLP
jgi:hypothetical protein